MTYEQRNAIVEPANGLLIYQTDVGSGFYYFNEAWRPISDFGPTGPTGPTGDTGPAGLTSDNDQENTAAFLPDEVVVGYNTYDNALHYLLNIRDFSYLRRQEQSGDKQFNNPKNLRVMDQEIEKAYPELVTNDGYRSVDYAQITPFLVEAIKELALKNQKLETKVLEIDMLKIELASLKAMFLKKINIQEINKK